MFQFLTPIQGFQILSYHGHCPLNSLPNLCLWLGHKEVGTTGMADNFLGRFYSILRQALILPGMSVTRK